jgi:hypothetical protein
MLCKKSHQMLYNTEYKSVFCSRHEIESASQIKGTRIEAIDIAVALIILKARHRLSNRCLSDILNLLRILRVRHVPSS